MTEKSRTRADGPTGDGKAQNRLSLNVSMYLIVKVVDMLRRCVRSLRFIDGGSISQPVQYTN